MNRRCLLIVSVLLAACGCSSVTSPPADTGGDRGRAATEVSADATPQRDRSKPRRSRAPARSTAKRSRAAEGAAAKALAALPVKGRAPKTGYAREQFGAGWIDSGGCDTRDRVLARDLQRKSLLDRCRVAAGELDDPYTAARVSFRRGGASEVDIDHVVALSDAWQKGAQQWSRARRVAFANDPLNLLAVDASANRQKSDGDAATWLPANKRFRCAYVARQVAVKRKYRLWVTAAERDAIARVLRKCPGQRLPKAGPRVRIGGHTVRRQRSRTGRRRTGPSRRAARAYPNCDAARAAGVAPIMRSSPAYPPNRHLDRDGDGVACES